MRLGVLTTHPIQYQAPLYRALADHLDVEVFFAYEQTAEGQADAGFGVAFEWDVPLLDGYPSRQLRNVAERPSLLRFGGCDAPEIAEVIAREPFDAFMVCGWNLKCYWQALVACWRAGVPVLVRGDSHLQTPRSWAKRVVKAAAYRTFIPRFDAYLAVGERSREYYLHYGADPSRIFFAPHFVDNAFFGARAEAADPDALRAELGLGPDAYLLLFAGKFMPIKRPVDLVRAAGRLRSRGHDAHVVMVGAGALEADVRAVANASGVPTHFMGFKNQSELPYYYAGSDVLVVPSESETWGLVVNEAMACGLPAVVIEEAGCTPDLIDPGETGYAFPSGDVAALTDALEAAAGMRRSPRVQRALAAKMRTYALATAVEGVVDAVEAVSGASSGRRPDAHAVPEAAVSP